MDNERGREVDESYINGFKKEKPFRSIGAFWHKKLRILAILDLL